MIKVHVFWEGHKILRNLHLIFDWHYIVYRTKVRWRFRQILWPSQRIWTLRKSITHLKALRTQISVLRLIFLRCCRILLFSSLRVLSRSLLDWWSIASLMLDKIRKKENWGSWNRNKKDSDNLHRKLTLFHNK